MSHNQLKLSRSFSSYCSFSYFVAFSLSRSLCIVEFLLVFFLWFLELPLPQIEQPSTRMQSRGKKCLEKKNQTYKCQLYKNLVLTMLQTQEIHNFFHNLLRWQIIISATSLSRGIITDHNLSSQLL